MSETEKDRLLLALLDANDALERAEEEETRARMALLQAMGRCRDADLAASRARVAYRECPIGVADLIKGVRDA